MITKTLPTEKARIGDSVEVIVDNNDYYNIINQPPQTIQNKDVYFEFKVDGKYIEIPLFSKSKQNSMGEDIYVEIYPSISEDGNNTKYYRDDIIKVKCGEKIKKDVDKFEVRFGKNDYNDTCIGYVDNKKILSNTKYIINDDIVPNDDEFGEMKSIYIKFITIKNFNG